MLNSKKMRKKNITMISTQNPEDEKIKEIKNAIDFSLITINLKNKNEIINSPISSIRILNNYTFEEALEYDRRSLCEIFFIYLLSKQIIFHTFLFKSPLELFTLRLCIFLFIFSSDLALNAFFYFNDNISKKYKYAKSLFSFTFANNITVILLSTLVGFFFLTLFIKLTSSVNTIRKIFLNEEEKMKKDKKYEVSEKRKKEIMIEIKKILRNHKIKVIVTIIIELILMIFFWYYVTIFCHIYPSTQISWLLDSLLSMLSRMIIDLLICLLLAKLYRIGVDSNFKGIYKIALFFYDFEIC